MQIFQEKKIDCHAHVLDPQAYPYPSNVTYKPSGQEIGTARQLVEVMKTFGTRHTLLVQPNSGYGGDNSCMLDAIRNYPKLFKGVAIVDLGASLSELQDLKASGIVGVAFNATFHGTEYYQNAAALIEKLCELEMFVNLQCELDQIESFVPWLKSIPVTAMIDHCGRPTIADGIGQRGFQALLELAETSRAYVKLSGYNKFSRTSYPFDDCRAYVEAIVDAYTLDRCLWASDWPYLRATDRQDYGPLLRLVEYLFPDTADRRKLLWETPNRLLSFSD